MKKSENGAASANGTVTATATLNGKPETNGTTKAAAVEKAELRKQVKGLNLEATINAIEELHRRKTQRDSLLETIKKLDEFEFKRREDGEGEDENLYNHCSIEISDDSRNEFSTRNANLIQALVKDLRMLCADKLSEIEAGITFPNV